MSTPSLAEFTSKLAFQTLAKVALKRFLAKLPAVFGAGPIGMLITHYVMKYVDELYDAAKEFIHVELLVFRNEQAQADFDQQAVGLYKLALEKGIDSDEFKKENEKNMDALSKFVRFGGLPKS